MGEDGWIGYNGRTSSGNLKNLVTYSSDTTPEGNAIYFECEGKIYREGNETIGNTDLRLSVAGYNFPVYQFGQIPIEGKEFTIPRTMYVLSRWDSNDSVFRMRVTAVNNVGTQLESL